MEAQDFGASLLYRGLAEGFRVVILGTKDQAKDEHFLAINGLYGYAHIEGVRPEDGKGINDQILAQIKRLRAQGFNFEFVVLPDPDLAKDVYRMGVPVLLYLHPHYSAESFRPDYQGGIRPWGELTDEVYRQHSARVEQILGRDR